MLRVALGLAVVAAVAFGGAAQASDYPTRPVKIIVPISAGSTTDLVARVVADQLTAAMGKPFVIENRPGAGGTIGAAAVAKSAPDGHTLLVHSSAHTVNPAIYSNLPYDTVAGFASVTTLATLPNILVMSPGKGVRTVPQLIALARSRPDELNFGSGGVGSAAHMNAEQFRAMANIKATHVPYRGTPEALADTIAGRVDFSFIPLANALGAIQDGRVLALAVGTENRSRLLPEVPTTVEAGVAGSAYNVWIGLFAPAATPRPIVDALNAAIAGGLASPEAKARLTAMGADAAIRRPEEFDAYIKEELVKIRALVQAAGIPTN